MSGDPAVSNGIDRAYDSLEKFVEGVGAVIGVDVNDDGGNDGRKLAGNGSRVTPLPAAPARAALPAPGSTSAPRDFEIIEVKGVGWIVTNGTESAKCDSHALAEQVLAAIRGKRP